jgi:hypothetical protein
VIRDLDGLAGLPRGAAHQVGEIAAHACSLRRHRDRYQAGTWIVRGQRSVIDTVVTCVLPAKLYTHCFVVPPVLTSLTNCAVTIGRRAVALSLAGGGGGGLEL